MAIGVMAGVRGYGRRDFLRQHRLMEYCRCLDAYMDIVLQEHGYTGKFTDDAPHLALVRLVKRGKKMVRAGLPRRR